MEIKKDKIHEIIQKKIKDMFTNIVTHVFNFFILTKTLSFLTFQVTIP